MIIFWTPVFATEPALIIACLSSQQFWPGLNDSTQRMRALGRHLVEIASMSLPDFEEFARIHVWREQSSKMVSLERELMNYHHPPDYWSRDLKAYLATMRASLVKPEYIVPQDLRNPYGLDRARELSRQLVMRFGQLLSEWPDIIESARQLRARGERLAAPV